MSKRHGLQIVWGNSDRDWPKDETTRLSDLLAGSEIAVIGSERIDAELVSNLPNLKHIVKYGVGLDNIDNSIYELTPISIHFTPGVNSYFVAEHSLGCILALLRNLLLNHKLLGSGIWNKDGGSSLKGKVIGIVGCGNIGRALVKLLRPFEVKILVADILDKSDFCTKNNCVQVDFDILVRQSDIVSIHVPKTDLTDRMFDERVFNAMKSTALLINTARGSVVDLENLHQALIHGKIAGAACDVFPKEPIGRHAILSHDNFIGTPHTSANSVESVLAMGGAVLKSITNILED